MWVKVWMYVIPCDGLSICSGISLLMTRNTGIDSSIPATLYRTREWMDILHQYSWFACPIYLWLCLIIISLWSNAWLNFICKKVLFLLKCQVYESHFWVCQRWTWKSAKKPLSHLKNCKANSDSWFLTIFTAHKLVNLK